jgi:hypothetical protein
MSLASNPFFWLGQFGVGVVILHSILVCYRHRNKIPTVAIFFSLAVISLNVLVHPAIYVPSFLSPTLVYLLLFLAGAGALCREVKLYRAAKRAAVSETQKRQLTITRKVWIWGSIALAVISGFIGIKSR